MNTDDSTYPEQNETSDNRTAEIDYKSWQKTFYIATGMEFLAAVFFLLTAFFVVQDWNKAIQDEKGINSSLVKPDSGRLFFIIIVLRFL